MALDNITELLLGVKVIIFSLVLELYLASAQFLRIPICKRKEGYNGVRRR